MKISNPAAREKLSARFYFARGDEDFRDLGDALLAKQEPKIDYAPVFSARRGHLRLTHEEPGKLDLRYTGKLQEHAGANLEALTLARRGEAVYNAVGGMESWFSTILLNDNEYPSLYWNLIADDDEFILKIYSDAAKTVMVAQSEAMAHGGSAIVSLNEVSDSGISGSMFYYSTDEYFFETTANDQFIQPTFTYTLYADSYISGTAMLVLSDGQQAAPKKVMTFPATLKPSSWGDHDPAKFNEFSIDLLATDEITIVTRE